MSFLGKIDVNIDRFFLMASRTADGYFNFESLLVSSFYFPDINISVDYDKNNFQCITGKYNQSSKKLQRSRPNSP